MDEPLLVSSPLGRNSAMDEHLLLISPLGRNSVRKERIIFGESERDGKEEEDGDEKVKLRQSRSRSQWGRVAQMWKSNHKKLPPLPEDEIEEKSHNRCNSSSKLVEEEFANYGKKKHLHRSHTAPAMAVIDLDANPKNNPRLNRCLHPQMRSADTYMVQALLLILLYLAIGVAIYVWWDDDFSGNSTHGLIDGLYFCIVTMCTIGYGDITPSTPEAKIFCCVFVLLGFGFIDILLSSMLNFFLDRQEALLLHALEVEHATSSNYIMDVKKRRMRIRTKVALAFGVVTLSIGLGTVVMHFLESLQWLDAFYLACMSVTTVGYGDHAFTTAEGRLFASIWLLVSTLAVARSFIFLAEARIDKRQRSIAKWVLQREMTFGDLVAADLDADGSVSKAEFVVYKLKEMGKVEDKDIQQICSQFNKLDTDNCGRITLSYLINHNEEHAGAN